MTPHEPANPPPGLPFSVRPGTLADLSDVLAIQLAAPEAPHWNEREYARIFEPQDITTPALRRLLLVATSPTECPARSLAPPPLGFLVCSMLASTVPNLVPNLSVATIENLAVSPRARRRGMGEALGREALAWAVRNRASVIELEVRSSNLPAIRIYERLGFRALRRRIAYYRDPVEDAILMEKIL